MVTSTSSSYCIQLVIVYIAMSLRSIKGSLLIAALLWKTEDSGVMVTASLEAKPTKSVLIPVHAMLKALLY